MSCFQSKPNTSLIIPALAAIATSGNVQFLRNPDVVRKRIGKAAYAYLLTPRGIEEKTQITIRFFRQKMLEYEQLKHEIEELEREVRNQEAAKREDLNQ